jgi:septum formation protein
MVNTDHPISPKAPLVLASTSPYRAALLKRLNVPFEAQASKVDEMRYPGEVLEEMAERLARMKASALRVRFPARWILGSDQVASLAGQPMGKPGNRVRAIEQLAMSAGRTVIFYTCAALFGPNKQIATVTDATRVRFRKLSPGEIERYVDAEKPFDCAGSFKCEGLGISLFEDISSHDPTALIGLPLIGVRRMLAETAGFSVP